MRRERRGSAATEFGLVLPVLVLWALGTVELGRALDLKQAVVSAAHDGARAGGRTDGPAGDPTAAILALAEAAAREVLTDAGVTCGAGCTVTATALDASGARWVEVEVTVPFALAFTPRFTPASLSARASVPFRRQP